MTRTEHALVTTECEDGVAVLTLDHPPVNALNQAMRAALLDAFASANADAAVRAIAILCAGRTFVAGAEVREFGAPPLPPFLPALLAAIEASAKPVVTGIHGTALGGGFELALASHYRVATADAQLGLPEVKLGLVPGAGGTQRLPRLVGVGAALRIIITGEPISAETARALGAIDAIAQGELRACTIRAAHRLTQEPAAIRRTGTLPIPPFDPSLFADAERSVAQKQPALMAPRACVDAVRAATELPFIQGLERERALFLELRASAQAGALRHAFLGEREVAKVPGVASASARAIERVAVIGAGTMGSGIAMCFASAGMPVTLVETQGDALARGLAAVRRNYEATAARGGLAPGDVDARIALIHGTLDWSALAPADLVIEAVFEDIDVKREVFTRLDRTARPGAILASNTSYLSIEKLASFTARPQDVVGMHFFSPAHVMRLLENVRTAATAPDVLATVMKIGKTIGKVAVMVGDGYGFVGNRMLAVRNREALFLLEEGALPRQVDRALVDFGFAMGPFAVGDLAGLDIGWRNRKSRAHLRPPGVRDCTLLDQVCELGRFGQKTGAGWYRYEGGSRKPIDDPAIEALIVRHSAQHGIARRSIDDAEVVERCLFATINEGARILEDGIASRPVDIDQVWLHGYAFPRWRGGPMFHADQVGLDVVLAATLRLRDRFGPDFWTPPALLARLAATDEGFYSSAGRGGDILR